MSANERRAEIMRIMNGRRHEKISCLAAELDVTDRTIRNDITALTAEYPLETHRGHNGCVKLPDWYYPHRHILSMEQHRVLSQVLEKADEYQAKVIREILHAYGANLYDRKEEQNA